MYTLWNTITAVSHFDERHIDQQVLSSLPLFIVLMLIYLLTAIGLTPGGTRLNI